METYTVTHYGFETKKIKIEAASPREAITKAFGDMGEMSSVRHGFKTKFLRVDGSVWFSVQ